MNFFARCKQGKEDLEGGFDLIVAALSYGDSHFDIGDSPG